MLYWKRYFQEYRINFRKTSETTKYFVVSKYNMRLHTAFVHATAQWYTFIREKTGITHILNFIATWLFYVNPGRKKSEFLQPLPVMFKMKEVLLFYGIGWNRVQSMNANNLLDLPRKYPSSFCWRISYLLFCKNNYSIKIFHAKAKLKANV